jgi:glycosyltransferase involved in cell wall biosynthesis
VVVTSEAEGFGIPVIEAMACGATVVATDIPVLREVGAGGALYAPLADIDAWTALLDGLLRGEIEGPSKDRRLERAKSFSWGRHARTILEAYRNIAKYGVPNAEGSEALSTHSRRHVSEEDVAWRR